MDGITDKQGESWETSEKNIKNMLENNLCLKSECMETEHAHIVSQFQQHGRPRPIVVNFVSKMDNPSSLL